MPPIHMTPPDSLTLGAGEYYRGTERTSDHESHLADGTPQSPSGAPLRGLGACGGSTLAPAAVLTDVTESDRLTSGAVLVTRQTDPGWGPIFPLVSGLVIERGGMLSHGAILAREYGIPTVVGVANAVGRITTGTCLEVDGDRGDVRLIA